jgi:hypothetical protein
MRGNELRTFHFHARVDRPDHLGALRLGPRCPERSEIAQSSNHGARLHAGWRGWRRPLLIAEARDGGQIFGVVQVACGVFKGNLPPLALDTAYPKLVGGRSGLRHVPNHPRDGRIVQSEGGELGGQRPVPGIGAISATVSPRLARTRMQALVAPSAVQPVRPDVATARTVEDPGQRIDPVPPTWRAAPTVLSSNSANPFPEFVTNRRVVPPPSGDALLGSASTMASTGAHRPAVVDRVHDDLTGSFGRDAVLAPETFETDVSSRVPIEHLHDPTDRLRIDLEQVWRFGLPTKPDGCIACRVSVTAVPSLIAVGDPLAQTAAVDLGAMRFANHLIPVVRVAREQASIAHDQRYAGRMKGVFNELEEAAQVALPTVGVSGEEHVELARPSGRKHLGHLGVPPHGPAGLGNLPAQAGVDQAETLGEAVHLLALAVRSVAVELLVCRLAHPSGRTKAAEIVQGTRKGSLHHDLITSFLPVIRACYAAGLPRLRTARSSLRAGGLSDWTPERGVDRLAMSVHLGRTAMRGTPPSVPPGLAMVTTEPCVGWIAPDGSHWYDEFGRPAGVHRDV